MPIDDTESFIIAVSPTPNAFYISDSAGNDNNDGKSESSPWRTLNKVNNALNSGIIPQNSHILLKRGDTFSGYIRIPIDGLSINEPLTIGTYGTGDKPIITGGGANAAIEIFTHGYIKIKNISFNNINRMLWVEDYCSHIELDGIEGTNYVRFGGIVFRDHINNVYIHDCYFDSTDRQPSNMDTIYATGLSYALIENNTFLNASHNSITLYGAPQQGQHGDVGEWVVVRNNYFDDLRHSVCILYGQQHTLLENNYIKKTKYTGIDGGCEQYGGLTDYIIRNNIFYEPMGEKSIGAWGTDLILLDATRVSMYNNTFYSTGTNGSLHRVLQHALYNGVNNIKHIHYINNIIYATNTSQAVSTTKGAEASGTFSDLFFKNNMFYVGDEPTSNIFHFNRGGNLYYNLPTLQGPSPPQADWVTFVDNTWDNPQLNADMSLQSGSPALNNGIPLAEATGTGYGNQIPVSHAFYFYPQVQILNLIVPGDNIFVGANENLEILSIDYENNILVIDKQISYSTGDKISLSRYGMTPNIGAL